MCCDALTDCDPGGQADLRVHTAFEGFQLSVMAFLATVEERSKFAWYPKPLFEHDATNEEDEEVLKVEDDEGSDDPALDAFLDALTDVFYSGREWVGPARVHIGHFVRARVFDGNDRTSAL